MNNELKPCPFDSDRTVWVEETKCGDFIEYQVLCHCGASGPIRRDYIEAIESWNTRHSEEK